MVAILGPTASGKSALAEVAAAIFGASILSVDSMQVYRGMDIGTAKAPQSVRERIAHHMIDVAEPASEFSVAEFQRQGRAAMDSAVQGRERIIIVGGSGLHFRSLVDPMTFAPTDAEIREGLESTPLDELQQELLSIDDQAPSVLDMCNRRRVIRAIEVWRITEKTPSERARSSESDAVRRYEPLIRGRRWTGGVPGSRGRLVASRCRRRLDAGRLNGRATVAPLLGRTAAQALGYKALLGVVSGDVTMEEAREEVIRATRALVKRQRTFFRRDPRIEWQAWQDDEVQRIEMAVSRVGEVAGWNS